MIINTLIKIYETDSITEFKEKIYINFCEDYQISAMNDIYIQDGKIYSDVHEYRWKELIDAYIEQISGVVLEQKIIDSLLKDSVDTSSVQEISYALLYAAMNGKDGNLLLEGLRLIDVAFSQGILKAVQNIEVREFAKDYENNILLSMKYANKTGCKSIPEHLVNLIFSIIILNNTNSARDEIKEFIEILCETLSNYLEAFLIREFECEIVAEKIIRGEEAKLEKKVANEISEIGFARYKEAFAKRKQQ